MSFHEVRFPTAISLRASGGPERRTQIVTLTSGHEERNTPWAHARRRYNAGLGVRSLDDIHEVIAFFEARRGRLYGFRWKDPTDHRSGPPQRAVSALDQEIGIGDAAVQDFALLKTYASGGASYVRPIAKPVAGTVLIALDDQPLVPESEFTVDTATGIVSLATAPAAGVRVTAGYEFDVPVRFDTDHLDIGLAGFEAGEIPDIPILELRQG